MSSHRFCVQIEANGLWDILMYLGSKSNSFFDVTTEVKFHFGLVSLTVFTNKAGSRVFNWIYRQTKMTDWTCLWVFFCCIGKVSCALSQYMQNPGVQFLPLSLRLWPHEWRKFSSVRGLRDLRVCRRIGKDSPDVTVWCRWCSFFTLMMLTA